MQNYLSNGVRQSQPQRPPLRSPPRRSPSLKRKSTTLSDRKNAIPAKNEAWYSGNSLSPRRPPVRNDSSECSEPRLSLHSPSPPRRLNLTERFAAEGFEYHARGCTPCREGDGRRPVPFDCDRPELADAVAQLLYQDSDSFIRSTADGGRVDASSYPKVRERLDLIACGRHYNLSPPDSAFDVVLQEPLPIRLRSQGKFPSGLQSAPQSEQQATIPSYLTESEGEGELQKPRSMQGHGPHLKPRKTSPSRQRLPSPSFYDDRYVKSLHGSRIGSDPSTEGEESDSIRNKGAIRQRSQAHLHTPTISTPEKAQFDSRSSGAWNAPIKIPETSLHRGHQANEATNTQSQIQRPTDAAIWAIPTPGSAVTLSSSQKGPRIPTSTLTEIRTEIAQGSNHRSLDGDEPAVTATSGVPQRFSDDIQPGPSVIMTSRERETHKCDIADPESLLCRLELSLKRSVIHQLLEHALCEGAETFEGSDASGEHGGNSHSSEGRSRSAASTSGAGRLLGQKRQRRTRGQEDTDEEGAGEDGDDGDERRKKRGGPNFAKGPKILRRLKCPFYKRDPNKHSRAACRGEGFADMAKVKDHLKRVHSQPLRCPRCWEEMESEDLRVQHLQQDESCNKRPEPIDDRISLQQWRRLDFKKAPYAYARTAEEKWKILYRTLFPDDVDIPSPYEDHGISLQYERLLAVSLQEELEREFEPILEPILSRIRDKIPSIIRRCKIRLLEESDKDVIYTPSGSSNRSNSHGSNESQDSGRQSAARLPNTTSEPSYNPLLSEAADASSFDLSTDIPPNASAPPWSSPSPWDLLYSNFDFQSYMKDFGQ